MKKTAKLTKIGRLIQEHYLNSIPEELKNSNTPINRQKIETSFKQQLDKLKEDKVIDKYVAQCDEFNNTAEIIKEKKLKINVYFLPHNKDKWRLIEIDIETVSELEQN